MPEVITNGDDRYLFEPGKGVGGIHHPDARMVREARGQFLASLRVNSVVCAGKNRDSLTRPPRSSDEPACDRAIAIR